MDREESVLKIFPSRIRQALEQTELNMENLQEIRVRVGQPLLCVYRGREFFLAGNGKLEEQEKKSGDSVRRGAAGDGFPMFPVTPCNAFDRGTAAGLYYDSGRPQSGNRGKDCDGGGKDPQRPVYFLSQCTAVPRKKRMRRPGLSLSGKKRTVLPYADHFAAPVRKKPRCCGILSGRRLTETTCLRARMWAWWMSGRKSAAPTGECPERPGDPHGCAGLLSQGGGHDDAGPLHGAGYCGGG